MRCYSILGTFKWCNFWRLTHLTKFKNYAALRKHHLRRTFNINININQVQVWYAVRDNIFLGFHYFCCYLIHTLVCSYLLVINPCWCYCAFLTLFVISSESIRWWKIMRLEIKRNEGRDKKGVRSGPCWARTMEWGILRTLLLMTPQILIGIFFYF